jgi:hypothetical protein
MHLFILFALATALFTGEAGFDPSLWQNTKKDNSWEYLRPDKQNSIFSGKKHMVKNVSELVYAAPITHPVNVFAVITSIERSRKTDGRGLVVVDANKQSYFMTIGDDYEAGIFSEQKAGNSDMEKYYDFVPIYDKFAVQLNKPYEIRYHVSRNQIGFHVKGEGINRAFKADRDIAFPVQLFLLAQRGQAVFENVKITSVTTGNDKDKK